MTTKNVLKHEVKRSFPLTVFSKHQPIEIETVLQHKTLNYKWVIQSVVEDEWPVVHLHLFPLWQN